MGAVEEADKRGNVKDQLESLIQQMHKSGILYAEAVREFTAELATLFVLFTLLVNATTLGLAMRALGLNKLSRVEVALRDRVLALSRVNVQRQLPRGAILEVGYFGSKGTHLLGRIDLNEARPGAALAAGLHAPNGNTVFSTADTPNINAVRPFLGFSGFQSIESAFDSNYHSLQMHLRKNFRGAGQFAVAYTYSKVLTDNSSDESHDYYWKLVRSAEKAEKAGA